MKGLTLFAAELKLIVRSPMTIAAHLSACLALMGFLCVPGVRLDLPQLLPGATGSAVMSCAAGVAALLGAARVRDDSGKGVLSSLSSLPVGRGAVFLSRLFAAAAAGLCETAAVFAFSLLFGAPFVPRMLLSVPAALPEALFFSAVGIAAGCVLRKNGVFALCGLAVSMGGIWLTDLAFERALMPPWLETAVALTPRAAFTDLIRAAFRPLPGFPVRAAALSAAYAVFSVLWSAAVMKRALDKAENNIFYEMHLK